MISVDEETTAIKTTTVTGATAGAVAGTGQTVVTVLTANTTAILMTIPVKSRRTASDIDRAPRATL